MLAMAAVSWLGAFLLRFEFHFPLEEFVEFGYSLPLMLVLRAVSFAWFRLDRLQPRHADLADLLRTGISITAATAVFAVIVRGLLPELYFSRSVILLDWLLLQMLFTTYYTWPRLHRRARAGTAAARGRAVVVGEGEALEQVLADMAYSRRWVATAVVTRSLAKLGDRVRGVTVAGAPAELGPILDRLRPHVVCFVSPGIESPELLRMTRECRARQIEYVVLRSRQSLPDPTRNDIDMAAVEMLLQREEVAIDLDAVRGMIEGRRILVTGAGGSIGSELCRQISVFRPASLHLVERSENGLFFIHRELAGLAPAIEVTPVLLDICDERALRDEFERARPEIVFHAAAHKHVGMMQRAPWQAFRNNVIGTWTVARAAQAVGAKRFVNISTDKAVRPESYMGFSKRLAEICVQELNRPGSTEFVNVRFGNVAGSVGSVIQIFRQQIESGGPVTVTDPRARRYFMSIPEAVRLVLQAAVFSHTRGLFTLDMREPIEIYELARTMIAMAGYVPGEDIAIEFTRLAPGEKLYEELREPAERVMPTPHERVWRLEREHYRAWDLTAQLPEWRAALEAGNHGPVLDQANQIWRELRARAGEPEREPAALLEPERLASARTQ